MLDFYPEVGGSVLVRKFGTCLLNGVTSHVRGGTCNGPGGTVCGAHTEVRCNVLNLMVRSLAFRVEWKQDRRRGIRQSVEIFWYFGQLYVR
jgi:hypothetical protein